MTELFNHKKKLITAEAEHDIHDEDSYNLKSMIVRRNCKLHDEKDYESTPLVLDEKWTKGSKEFCEGIKFKRD